jgi:hypothetical protein
MRPKKIFQEKKKKEHTHTAEITDSRTEFNIVFHDYEPDFFLKTSFGYTKIVKFHFGLTYIILLVYQYTRIPRMMLPVQMFSNKTWGSKMTDSLQFRIFL